MTTYQVAFHPTTKATTIQANGDALPAGMVKAGTFVHDHAADKYDGVTPEDVDPNHVLWHHVRDVLYRYGQEDMSIVKILQDKDYLALVSFTQVPATVTLAVNATQQITHVFTPTGASNKNIIYITSNPVKATVSASGLITAKQSGSATITGTSEDGSFTHTTVVTIS